MVPEIGVGFQVSRAVRGLRREWEVLAGDWSKISVGVIFELIEFLTLDGESCDSLLRRLSARFAGVIHWRDDYNFTGSITSIGRFGDG